MADAAAATRRTLTPFERAAVEALWRRTTMSRRALREAVLAPMTRPTRLDASLLHDVARFDGVVAGDACALALSSLATVPWTSIGGAICPIITGVLAHAIVGASDCWWAVLADGRYAVAVRVAGGVTWDRWCAVCARWRAAEATSCWMCGLAPLSVKYERYRPGRWYRAALALTAEHRALLDAALALGGEHWDVLGDALEADGQVRRGRKVKAAERWPGRHEWPRWRTK